MARRVWVIGILDYGFRYLHIRSERVRRYIDVPSYINGVQGYNTLFRILA